MLLAIPLGGKYDHLMTIVDDDIAARLQGYKIYGIIDVHRNIYAAFYDKHTKCKIRLHRFILNASHGQQIDHKDGNGLNNIRTNLRFCTVQQNQMNYRKHRETSSYFKGVSWNKRAKIWVSYARLNKQYFYLGSFINEEEAARAYNRFILNFFDPDFLVFNEVEPKF